jgi:hypothetical protein
MALQAIRAEAVATSKTYGGLQNVVADGTAACTCEYVETVSGQYGSQTNVPSKFHYAAGCEIGEMRLPTDHSVE